MPAAYGKIVRDPSLVTTAQAQVDYFLKIDGIEGESQDKAHPRELQLHSWTWGEKQAHSAATGGGLGAGKVSMSDFRFVMPISKASPKLILACAQGTHIKNAVLTCRKAGVQQQDYLKITFTDLLVSSYDASGEPTEGIPSEQVSLAYTKIQVDYREQKADGTLGGAISCNYDLKQQSGA